MVWDDFDLVVMEGQSHRGTKLAPGAAGTKPHAVDNIVSRARKHSAATARSNSQANILTDVDAGGADRARTREMMFTKVMSLLSELSHHQLVSVAQSCLTRVAEQQMARVEEGEAKQEVAFNDGAG